MRYHPERQLSPPAFEKRTLDRVACAIRSGHWANGPRARDVEVRIAHELEVPPSHVVATSSGTAGLWAACKVLDVECPYVCPLTWPATYSGTDGYPVWVDYDNPEVDIGVDLWGKCHKGSPLILDASHRFLAKEHKARLNSPDRITRAIVYSFAPQKEVPSPDGGAIAFSNADLAKAARWHLSGCVRDRKWSSPAAGNCGSKGLMTDVTAAFVREGMNQHIKRKEKRQQVLAWYERHLGRMLITRPCDSSGHLCVVAVPSPAVRNHWRRVLDRVGIPWGHHYAMNDEQRLACPIAASLSDQIISLPCHVRMDAGAVRRVCMRVLTA